jgi:hypothetical protein
VVVVVWVERALPSTFSVVLRETERGKASGRSEAGVDDVEGKGWDGEGRVGVVNAIGAVADVEGAVDAEGEE